MTLVKRDLAELREQSDALRSNAWLTMQTGERLELLRQFCVGYWVPPSIWRLLATFRAQENEDGEPFNHVDRLLAPPAHCVTTNGRLNRAGEPTLYLAATPFSALREIEAEHGCVATILAARIRLDAPPFSLAPVAMSAHRGTSRIGEYAPRFSLGALSHQQFKTHLSETGCLKQWLIQQEAITHLLTLRLPPNQEQMLYELTNEFREVLFSCGTPYEGVEYPSVADGRASPNIALNRERWADIEPLEVWVVKVGADLATPNQMMIGSKPLLWFGTIKEDGSIYYERTEKSLLAATADFKQKHGMSTISSAAHGMQPVLRRGFTRYRISFGTEPGRVCMDFQPAGSGRIYWTPE